MDDGFGKNMFARFEESCNLLQNGKANEKKVKS